MLNLNKKGTKLPDGTGSELARLLLIAYNGTTHEDYNRVVELAKNYYILATGIGMDGKLKKIARREDDQMFNQRVAITQHITQTVTGNLRDVKYKISRSNSLTRVLAYDQANELKQAEINSLVDTFWGTKSLDQYVFTRVLELEDTDPNAWIIIDWSDFDNTTERAKPYPFEAGSDKAKMFEYDKGILQYLVVNQMENDLSTWYYYGQNQVYKLVENYDKEIINLFAGYRQNEIQVAEYEGITYYFIGNTAYQLIEPLPHKLGFVNAFRVGYNRDIATGGKTYVNFWNAAVPILEKSIKVNSELDLAMALSAHPQSLRYVHPCSNPECVNGHLPDDSICKVCGGTGFKVATSTQDTVTLRLPKNPEDMFDLDNLVKYVSYPVDIIKFQDEYIAKLIAWSKDAVFNSDLYSQAEIADTATGKNIALQAIYDTLYPLAINVANIWEFSVNTIAAITDLSEGLIASFTFSKDFKMKSKDTLLLDYQKAREAGAPEFIINEIIDDIIRIDYEESPEMFNRFKTHQYFFPFTGKSKEEIISIIASQSTTDFYAFLYSNYDSIFTEIELEKPEFYTLIRPKQWEIIKAKTNELIAAKPAPKQPMF